MRIILTGAFLLSAFLSFSQDQLSLSDAIQLGLRNNFQIQIAEKTAIMSEKNNTWGEAGMLPTINLNVSQGNTINDQSKNPTAFIQGKLLSNSLQYGADLNWTLFNGFRAKITKDQLAMLVDQSQGNAALTVENSVHSIVLGYYNVLLLRERLNVLEVVKNLSRDRYAYEQEKKQLGVVSSLDIIQFETQFISDSINYLNEELAFKNSCRNLNMLMSVDVEREYAYTGQLKPSPLTYNYQVMEEKMLSNNQTLKNQFVNLELQQKKTGLARSALYPVLSFNIGGNQSANRFEVSSLGLSGNGGALTYYANFSLNYTLFNGGKRRRAIDNSKMLEEIELLKTEEIQLSLNNQLKTQFELYGARYKILVLLEENKNNAKESYSIGQERFKIGSINSFNLRDLEIAFRNLELQTLQAVFNLVETNTDLLRLTGGIVDVYDVN